jgi:hypothetical protein
MPNEDASSRRKRDVWGLLGRIGRPGLADRSSPANQRSGNNIGACCLSSNVAFFGM